MSSDKKSKPAPTAREFLVLKDGKSTDASLHDPILEAGDDAAAQAVGRAAAKRAGLTDEEIAQLFSHLRRKK